MGSAASSPAEPPPAKGKREDTPLLPQEEGALEAGGAINIYDWRRCGYLLQYFSVGLIYGGLPATSYGLYIAYLNVPAYISGAASTLRDFPWSLKVVFALLTDACPIGGYRRRPFMAGGWLIACIFLVALAATPLPDPYYCTDVTGQYNLSSTCNAAAASSGMPIAVLMCMVAVGYVQADVAADALTVQYARREPAATRGRTQTTAYLVRTVGQICAQLLVGLGMNGREYNGTFDAGLSFQAICALLAVPAALMVPISWYLVEEPRITTTSRASEKAHKPAAPAATAKSSSGVGQTVGELGSSAMALLGGKGSPSAKAPPVVAEEAPAPPEEPEVWTVGGYLSTAWGLIKSALVFEVAGYLFLSGMVGGIGTTAGAEVQRVWADVQNLQNQLFAIAGNGLFVFGLYLMRTRYLHVSWRWMTASTVVLSNLIDMPFTFLTIFDVVRNQYFFLDDSLLTSIPSAMNFVVSTYVMVEVAEPGTEGITYGILTTAGNLGGPVASGISNALFGLYRPSLSLADNYVEDSPMFRNVVANSYWVSYGFAFVSLIFLPLLPDQKADTQWRKENRPRHQCYGILTIVCIVLAVAYSLTVDMLAIFPATSCLHIAGGEGCGDDGPE